MKFTQTYTDLHRLTKTNLHRHLRETFKAQS